MWFPLSWITGNHWPQLPSWGARGGWAASGISERAVRCRSPFPAVQHPGKGRGYGTQEGGHHRRAGIRRRSVPAAATRPSCCSPRQRRLEAEGGGAGLGRAGQGAGRAPCATAEQAGSFRAGKEFLASLGAPVGLAWTFWAGAGMGRRQGTPWDARPYCLHVAWAGRAGHAGPCAQDPRAAPRGSLGGGGGEPAWVGRCSFLQGPGRDLGAECPEHCPGRQERGRAGADGGLGPQLRGRQSETKWVIQSLCFLSWQCLWSQRGGHRQQDRAGHGEWHHCVIPIPRLSCCLCNSEQDCGGGCKSR